MTFVGIRFFADNFLLRFLNAEFDDLLFYSTKFKWGFPLETNKKHFLRIGFTLMPFNTFNLHTYDKHKFIMSIEISERWLFIVDLVKIKNIQTYFSMYYYIKFMFT